MAYQNAYVALAPLANPAVVVPAAPPVVAGTAFALGDITEATREHSSRKQLREQQPGLVTQAEEAAAAIRTFHIVQEHAAPAGVAPAWFAVGLAAGLAAGLAPLAALASNERRKRQNRENRVQGPNQPAHMMLKEIVGWGNVLANNVAPAGMVAPPAPAALPNINTAPAPPFPVPATFGDIQNLTHVQLMELICFYNEDFGILQPEHVGIRRAKFERWLCH